MIRTTCIATIRGHQPIKTLNWFSRALFLVRQAARNVAQCINSSPASCLANGDSLPLRGKLYEPLLNITFCNLVQYCAQCWPCFHDGICQCLSEPDNKSSKRGIYLSSWKIISWRHSGRSIPRALKKKTQDNKWKIFKIRSKILSVCDT